MESVHWIILAAGAPLLWAIVNHIDKYFLSDRFSHAKVGISGGLMIFSTLFSVVVLPITYFLSHDVFSLSLQAITILILVGLLNSFSILLYLQALDKDEASIVVPIYQTIPFFSFIFSYLLLGETLTLLQVIGGVFIVFSSIILTLELDSESGIKIKRNILFLMLSAAALVGLSDSMFKFGAVTYNVTQAFFWENVGLFMFGLILLFFKKYRLSFISLVKKSPGRTTALNLASEGLTAFGNFLIRVAMLIAPVALVTSVSSVQPLFVFIISVLLTIFFPFISKEKISRKHLIHKVSCITCIVIGAIILSL
ncbi:MAG TPA: EamA family transporter [Candidatus Paceibacterota bacterium]|nr:EamA family transporter [Candidatus Paceibacterota bacterium]